MHKSDMSKPKKDWKQHQFTAVVINKVNLVLKSEMISVGVEKQKLACSLLSWGILVGLY